MATLKFDDGAIQFRQRLAVSILSNRPLLIRNIRSDSIFSPGLRPYEASFLRLVEKMSNGTVIEINSTGTQLRFNPGILIGGDLKHECPSGYFSSFIDEKIVEYDSNEVRITGRCVGWYLEGILPIAPFGKKSLTLTLTGITDGTGYVGLSPDYISSSLIPLMSRFGIGKSSTKGVNIFSSDFPPPTIRIISRGFSSTGNGIVEFFCPSVKEIVSIKFTDPGLIRRVRGTVSTCCLPPSFAAQAAHNAKGLILRLIPDVWVHTDVHSNRERKRINSYTNNSVEGMRIKENGFKNSPGMKIVMTSISTTGAVLCAETCLLDLNMRKEINSSENVGLRGAAMLLEEVHKGGCVDSRAQSLAFLFMCLTPQDVSTIRVGKLSQYSIISLRLFKRTFGVEFKVSVDDECKMVRLSCIGIGYQNMAKTAT